MRAKINLEKRGAEVAVVTCMIIAGVLLSAWSMLALAGVVGVSR